MMTRSKLPELLAPAGSPQALEAAVAAGADAVYFGGGAFNARMRAQNFTDEDVVRCIALCHAHGVKAYMTFNTLITDRELPAFLEAARKAYGAGADALILADAGAAELLHRALPDLPLHASTQCSIHNAAGVRAMAERGFCRVVPARELPRAEIAALKATCDTEIEVFVHGALCVSHSGQCLFSSLVGGRSGNRGECAQPCRLPDAKGKYPLSLKDLCLARDIPFFIENGVDSLKIEGRLKSPEYVHGVVSIYRRLLDEKRGATPAELNTLADIFSRSGFTDGYFAGKVDRSMLGVRSEADKRRTEGLAPPKILLPRVPLDLDFEMKRDTPIRLNVTCGERQVTVYGDPPLVAKNAPMDGAAVAGNLCRFGGTPYEAGNVKTHVEEGLMLPVSRLNALRRAALEALQDTGRNVEGPLPIPPLPRPQGAPVQTRSARFEYPSQITPAAKSCFAIRYLPLHGWESAPQGLANGVVIPPVILDGEWENIRTALQKAAQRGAKHALVGNVGHLPLAVEAALCPHGDFRLNVCNETALALNLARGFADVILSPELTLPQIRDIGGARDVIVYGRVPLMLLEKCVGREVGNCAACAEGKNQFTDRRGEKFPVFRLGEGHRNLLYNSRPTVMSDRARDLAAARVRGGHYIFSVESPTEVDAVIRAYREGTPLGNKIKRI